MATNQRRRSAERQLLQRQLEERRQREVRRRRLVLISSVVGTLVIIAGVVVAVVVATSGGGGGSGSTKASCDKSAFLGVTLKNPCNVKADSVPTISAKGQSTPTKLRYQDVVVGKGAAAKSSSTVQVQYSGLLYQGGKVFDASWKTGQAASFSLQQVVPGFGQGIGGTTGVPPMKVGGRRIIVMPGSLGYGASGNPQAGIAANAPLVFVVDLVAVK